MNKKNVILLLLVILSNIFLGCATMHSESMYAIPISTIPEKTNVKVTDRKGEEIIFTQSPDTLVLKADNGYFKRAEYLIEISHDDYQPQKDTLCFVLDGKYFQNFLLSFFMPVGFFIVDPISGAMWKPEYKKINVELEEKESVRD
ncbi:MAG: hypothetical protein PF448_04015 [Bacteroidales bacterium]|jgi:hypothetical protein|nr:hypothetical protein [Bacteroidales bacterium]